MDASLRLATPDDIPALLDIGEQFHAVANLRCGFSRADLAATLAQLIEQPTATIIMGPNGCIGGGLVPSYCDHSWIIAIEMFWWSQGGGLALLRAFEAWAEANGANEVRMSSITDLPRADAVLRRKGYAPKEISYEKVIQ